MHKSRTAVPDGRVYGVVVRASYGEQMINRSPHLRVLDGRATPGPKRVCRLLWALALMPFLLVAGCRLLFQIPEGGASTAPVGGEGAGVVVSGTSPVAAAKAPDEVFVGLPPWPVWIAQPTRSAVQSMPGEAARPAPAVATPQAPHSVRQVAAAGLPFGDVTALQDRGLLPRYDFIARTRVDADINWASTAGERGEIGLLPEDHATFLSGQTDLLQGILEVALRPPPPHISHEHKPNLYWLPYLMTGDVRYVRNMEATWRQFKDWRQKPYDSALDYYDMGRWLAWSLRDLAQLAFLQMLGVTEHRDYLPALNASRDRYLRIVLTDPMHQRWNVLAFNHVNDRSFGWTSWMESFVGQALAHTVRLGFEDWLPIANFQFQNLLKRSGREWPFKAVDSDHIFFADFANPPLSGKALQAWAATQTWRQITEYTPSLQRNPDYLALPDDRLIPVKVAGRWYTYVNRAQAAYAWAALAATIGIDGAREKRDQLAAAIRARGDTWETRYAIAVQQHTGVPAPPSRPSRATAPRAPPENRPAAAWSGWQRLPPNEFVEVPGNNAEIIRALLAERGFDRSRIRGSVEGSFKAWVGAAVDLEQGVAYIPWGGGHGDSSLNGIWKLDLETMGWSIEKMPSDPWAPGSTWSKAYWDSGSYSYYPGQPQPNDILPDGMPTSRHTYGGVWFDSLRREIHQSRMSWWRYRVGSKETTRTVFRGPGQEVLAPTIYHMLFHDEVNDFVYGRFALNQLDELRFARLDPKTGAWISLRHPFTGRVIRAMCRNGRMLYAWATGTGKEAFGVWDMDRQTWETYGEIPASPAYGYEQEMQGAVYIPEWGKVLRQYTAGALAGQWFLFDPFQKTQEPFRPAGISPFERLIGTKMFYYPPRNAVIYVSSQKTYVMRVK